jgi:hypothetical protein
MIAYLTLAPMYYPNLHNRWAVVGCETVTMIFWFVAPFPQSGGGAKSSRFAGFIAIADSTKASRFVCIGSGCNVLRCAKAAAAFGAFSWLAWCATLGLIVDALIKYRKGEHAADPGAGNNASSSKEGAGVEGAAGGPGGFISAPLTPGLHAPVKDMDIEMNGGGQKPLHNLSSEGLQLAHLPEEPMPAYHSNFQQQTYGHPPSNNDPGQTRIPDPSAFGGIH